MLLPLFAPLQRQMLLLLFPPAVRGHAPRLVHRQHVGHEQRHQGSDGDDHELNLQRAQIGAGERRLCCHACQVANGLRVHQQGNGGNDAFFQRDTAVTGGLFNFSDGSGGNYVQADSNNVIGTFDGGPSVGFNLLGQDNNNMSLLFVDFGNVIFA